MKRKAKYLLLISAFQCLALTHSGQVVIRMQKNNGVFTVPCKLNGRALNFIFDTGASDVSISLDEAIKLINSGLIDKNDLYGREYYQDATGRITEGIKVNIKSLEIGNITITNVEATILKTINAPLLLGQSALSKIGKVVFDPQNATLTILSKDIIEKSHTYDMFKDFLFNFSGPVDNFCGFRLLQYDECITNQLGDPDIIQKLSDSSKAFVYHLERNNDTADLIFQVEKLQYTTGFNQIISIQLTGVASHYSVRGIELGSPLTLIEQTFGHGYKLADAEGFKDAKLLTYDSYNISFLIENDMVVSIKVFYKPYDYKVMKEQISNFSLFKNAIKNLDSKSLVNLFAPDFEISKGPNIEPIRFSTGIENEKLSNKELLDFISDSIYGLKSLLNPKIIATNGLRITEKAGILLLLSFKNSPYIREVVLIPYLNKFLIWEIN